MKSAVVFGATGLVGSHLVQELNTNNTYEVIYVVVRSNFQIESHKIKIINSDYSNLDKDLDNVNATDAFICLGTTIKKAGSVEVVEQIDRDLPIQIAQILKVKNTQNLAVVSSVGAQSASKNYYLRIKGEMEEGLINQNFNHLAIVRPSIILGKRSEARIAETIGKAVMRILGVFMVGGLKKYRAIHARTIARSMINILNNKHEGIIFESDQLQVLGR